jgi:hypothetical protein
VAIAAGFVPPRRVSRVMIWSSVKPGSRAIAGVRYAQPLLQAGSRTGIGAPVSFSSSRRRRRR